MICFFRGFYIIVEEIYYSLYCIYIAFNFLMNKFVGLKGNVDILIDFVMKFCIMCNIYWGVGLNFSVFNLDFAIFFVL